jgi:ABC-2 type transport system permease protein
MSTITAASSDADSSVADLTLIREAVGSGAIPPPPSALTASRIHGWRALLKIRYVPEQLFDVTAFPIMMTLMFTYIFGGALAGSVKEYLQFFLPGILVQSILFITMYSGVGLNIDAERGVFDRFRSLPIWRPSAIIGPLLGDAVRYTIASTVIVLLGLALGFRPDGGVVGILLSVALILLFAFSLSWVWTALGLKMKTEKGVMSMAMMVLFPLTFISNIFVDPQTMPSVLRHIVDVNPVSWLADSVRGLMHDNLVTADLVKTLIASAVLVVVFAPMTMRLYKNKA